MNDSESCDVFNENVACKNKAVDNSIPFHSRKRVCQQWGKQNVFLPALFSTFDNLKGK